MGEPRGRHWGRLRLLAKGAGRGKAGIVQYNITNSAGLWAGVMNVFPLRQHLSHVIPAMPPPCPSTLLSQLVRHLDCSLLC